MSNLTSTYKGLSWLLAGLFLGVVLDLLIKIGGKVMTVEEVTFYRYSTGTLILFPFLLKQWIQKGFSITPYWHVHMLRGFLLFSAILLRGFGLQSASLNTVAVVAYAIPFFTLLLSVPFLQEHSSRARWIATTISFLAVVCAINPEKIPLSEAGILLLSSLCFSLGDVYNKKYIAKETTFYMLFHITLWAMVFSFYPSMRHASCGFWDGLLKHFPIVIGLGGGALVMYFCFLKSCQQMEASALACFQYCDFVISGFMDYFFFGITLTASTCCSFAVIVSCALFLTYKESKK